MNNAETIMQLAADYWGVSVEKMKLENSIPGARKREIVLSRQIAMVTIKQFTNLPLKAIGAMFGKRDHSTVIHAVDAIQDLEDTDRGFANRLTFFREMVMEGISTNDTFRPNEIDEEFEHLIPEKE